MKKYTQEHIITLLCNQLQVIIDLTENNDKLKQERKNSKVAILLAQEFLNKEN